MKGWEPCLLQLSNPRVLKVKLYLIALCLNWQMLQYNIIANINYTASMVLISKNCDNSKDIP